jgi:NHL repeat
MRWTVLLVRYRIIMQLVLLFSLAAAIAHAQTITTVAGSGDYHSSGDGGPALQAGMVPGDLALDSSGNLYLTDDDRFIRKVNPSGIITTVAGGGKNGRGDGGPASRATFNGLGGLTIDRLGNLYIADSYNNRVRKVAPDGIITTVAGKGPSDYIPCSGCMRTYNGGFSGDGGPATSAEINRPTGVAVDAQGNLYIADFLNDRIRKVNAAGIITTEAGGGKNARGDGGPATSAKLQEPFAVTVDHAGNIYFTEPDNNRVRKVNTAGIISTIAGNGAKGFSGDGGSATLAELNYPKFLAVDASGNLYIADAGNLRVRKVDSAGIISTVAGNGNKDFSGDGGPARLAEFTYFGGLAVDAAGNLYIADSHSNRVRKIPIQPKR